MKDNLSIEKLIAEEMKKHQTIKPQYQNIHVWEFYASNLLTEYQQSMEEGLDIERYKDLFFTVAGLPTDEIKKKLGDVLFEIVTTANITPIAPSGVTSDSIIKSG